MNHRLQRSLSAGMIVFQETAMCAKIEVNQLQQQQSWQWKMHFWRALKEKRNRGDQRKGRDNATNRGIGRRLRASHHWPFSTMIDLVVIDSVVNRLLSSRPIDDVC
ncbi:hypothetical protein ACFE04_022793 [Oxalis oulophora]